MLDQAIKDANAYTVAEFCGALVGEKYFPCEAMNYRLHKLQQAGVYDSWDTLPRNLRFEAVEPAHKFTGREAAYLIFEDGSLYFANNGGDEVWADAEDFAHQYFDAASTDHGVAVENLEMMDIQLLRHVADVTNGFGEIADAAEAARQ